MITVLALLLTAGSPAFAADTPVTVNTDDLLGESAFLEYEVVAVPLTTAAALDATSTCKAEKVGAEWKVSSSNCPALYRLQRAEIKLTGGDTVTLNPTRPAKGKVTSLEGLNFAPPPAKTTLVWYRNEQDALTKTPTNAVSVVWKGTDGVWSEGNVPPVQESPDAVASGERCETTTKGTELLIVVDRRNGGWVPTFYNGRDANERILRPNTPVRVCVQHPSNVAVDITLTGSRGLSIPTVSKQTGNFGSQSSAGTPAMITTTEIFSPRKPGSVDVQLKEGEKEARVVAEFEVAEAIAGVVRMGVAVGSVVDANYKVMTAPGSDQSEIVDTLYGSIAPELVLGFAPFFERGGRVYEVGKLNHVAPYIALGLVEADPSGGSTLSILKSVYLGAEFEIMRSSSVAATLVAKRVTRLTDPFQVGGPAASDADLVTRSGYQVGIALVFNLSPEFLEVARGGAKAKE